MWSETFAKEQNWLDTQNMRSDSAYICETLFLYFWYYSKKKKKNKTMSKNKAKLNGLCTWNLLSIMKCGHGTEKQKQKKNILQDISCGFGVSGCGIEPPAVNPSLIPSPDKLFITSQHCIVIPPMLSVCWLSLAACGQAPKHVPEHKTPICTGRTNYAMTKHCLLSLCCEKVAFRQGTSLS